MNAPRSSSELWVSHLGTVPYREAMELQQELRARRVAQELPDLMLLLEHPPTYTRGRRSQPGELPLGEERYRARGIEVIDTDRGGRVTYHGPGQLVGYLIMQVSDVVAHVRRIEAALVRALAEEGIRAHSRAAEGPDFTGVWVGERKVASIGVHLSRGVTTHGFAINVENDLAPFSWIVPCGLSGVAMTSIEEELGRPASLDGFRDRVSECFGELLCRRERVVSPVALGVPVGGANLSASRAHARARVGSANTTAERTAPSVVSA